MKRVLVLAGVSAAAVVAAVAARQERPFERGPISRLEMSLDSDHDGVISASEIGAAAAAIAGWRALSWPRRRHRVCNACR